jgi:VWFA-related protein
MLVAGSAGFVLSGALRGYAAEDKLPPQDPKEQGQKEDEHDYTIRSRSALVLLDVSVRDHNSRFVPGLVKENFKVFEDGKPQPVTVFDAEDRPVDLGILVDQSRSMTPKRADVLAAAQSLIEHSNRQDEVFVLNFNERVKPGLPEGVNFSNDVSQLSEALFRGRPEGRTALNDALTDGLEHLKLGMRDKKTLVVISDGGDNASRHTRIQTIEGVEKGTATVYVIGIYDPEDRDRDPGFLRRLADTSGGEAYFPSSTDELEPLCQGIAQEIRARYTVGYVPRESERDAIRSIHVRAEAPGLGHLRVRTRSRYRYEAEK